MEFWEDASPVVKGAIVVGAILVLYMGIAYMTGLPPYHSQVGEEVQQFRGLEPR